MFGKNKKLAQAIYTRPYDLVDLTQLPDEILRQYRWFGAAALLAKHIKNSDILQVFEIVLKSLRELERQGELDYIYESITYIFEAGNMENHKKDFIEVIKTSFSQIEEQKVMTLAELFRQEGRQEGIEQGIQQGRRESMTIAEQFRQEGVQRIQKAAINFLKVGLSLEQVSQGTGLSLEEVKELHDRKFRDTA